MSDIIGVLKGLPNQTKQGLEWLNHKGAATQYPYYEKIFETFDAKTILEIGTYLGYSLTTAALVSHGLERIDFIDDESYLKGSNDLAIENIRTVSQYVEICPWNNIIEAEISYRPDLVHIDGGHDYNNCLNDLEFAVKLKPKVIIGHDIELTEYSVKKAVRDFCDKHQLFHAILPEFTHGLYMICQGPFFDYVRDLSYIGVGEVRIIPPKWL